MTTSTAIVIGATGLVGRALVDQLASAAHVERVTTLTRRAMPHHSPKVVNHVVDFERLHAHEALFRGRFLFSALGTTLKQAGSAAAQRRVDFDYQFEAARLAAANGVAHYLLVSSSFADAASRHFYLRLKGEMEDAVLALGFERVSIFQPFVLLGARDAPRPLEAIGGRALRLASRAPGLRRLRPITATEVAAKMVRVSGRPGPAVERFDRQRMFER